MNKLLFVLFIFISNYTFSQQGFLFLQKGNKTIKTFTTGNYMQLQHKRNYAITGILAHIRKDSFSIYNYSIRRKTDIMGFVTFDTIYSGYDFYSVNDIKSIYVKKNKSIFQTLHNASSLLATLFTVTNIVNGIKYKDNFITISKNTIIKGGGFLVLSKVFKLFYKEDYVLNKNLKIVLMPYK